jgi:hypothetical protein
MPPLHFTCILLAKRVRGRRQGVSAFAYLVFAQFVPERFVDGYCADAQPAYETASGASRELRNCGRTYILTVVSPKASFPLWTTPFASSLASTRMPTWMRCVRSLASLRMCSKGGLSSLRTRCRKLPLRCLHTGGLKRKLTYSWTIQLSN